MAYGWYKVSKVDVDRREIEREKVWSRFYLSPFLQAETDRDWERRIKGAAEREAKIMENVEGWQAMDLKARIPGLTDIATTNEEIGAPVYYTKRDVRPSYVFIPGETKGNTSSDDELDSVFNNVTVPAQYWRGTRFNLNNPRYHNRKDFTTENPIGGSPISREEGVFKDSPINKV